jgi:hypothetical protein
MRLIFSYKPFPRHERGDTALTVSHFHLNQQTKQTLKSAANWAQFIDKLVDDEDLLPPAF